MAKVGFATKVLSNRNYIREVAVEGKATNKFNFRIGFYDQYAAQIIRSGNCITFLSNTITIYKETFWNTHHFEDLTKYVFWTFNKSFLQTLEENIETLRFSVLKRCLDLLQENFTPYDPRLANSADEELQWCFVKNDHLLADSKFAKMYSLDKENRTAILKTLKEKMDSFQTDENNARGVTTTAVKTPSFPDLLKPIDNKPNETLNLITQKLEEANLEFKLFSKIAKLPNGKNPYGMNGAIAAMIDYFYQHGYFKKEHSLEEIFQAYSAYTGNNIAKLKTFLSEFRQDNSYLKHFAKLNRLKINKLK